MGKRRKKRGGNKAPELRLTAVQWQTLEKAREVARAGIEVAMPLCPPLPDVSVVLGAKDVRFTLLETGDERFVVRCVMAGFKDGGSADSAPFGSLAEAQASYWEDLSCTFAGAIASALESSGAGQGDPGLRIHNRVSAGPFEGGPV